MNLDVQTLTAERIAKQTERTAKQAGLGATDGGIAIVQRYIKDTTEYVRTLKVPEDLSMLNPEVIALICLQTGLTSVGREHKQHETIYMLARTAEAEVFAAYIKDRTEGDKKRQKEIGRITQAIMKRHNSVSHRKTAFRSAFQRTGIKSLAAWDSKKSLKIGGWLFDICINSPVFVRVMEPYPHMTITEEALNIAGDIIDRLMATHPVMLPVFQQPEPWVDNTCIIDGYRHYMVRKTKDNVLQNTIRQAIKEGLMAPVLEAVNGIQNTAWQINPFIRDMLKWAVEERIEVDGVPRRHMDPPAREKPWEDMTDAERRVWKKKATDVAAANRVAVCDGLQMARDLATVDYIGDQTFWTPANLDYRGRVYFIPHFNFQRSDYIRALFQFAEGEPLTSEGLYWLKVHVANCGDFDKVSKKPFDERVKWVDDNMQRIRCMMIDPKEDLWWTEADSPFLFLAACHALVSPETECHIPVSFDGTCSGLQHLAAMTRCEDTAKLVNLVKVDKPGDVYLTVAELAERLIKADLANDELRNVAQVCLKNGITRSLVKRNVMTYSYSSGKFGMRQQHLDDTMAPLAFKVLEGKLENHPYSIEGEATPGYFASKYLAEKIHMAIEMVVRRPAEAMHFLQSCARATAHEGKPLVWHTPLGLPVVLRYPEYVSKQVTLFLHDRGVKIRSDVRMQEETKGIDKIRASNAVAPGFVHSMDACHLMEVVRRCNTEGIHSVALVHDSFGCLPNRATKFREIIKEAFVWLYDRDVLADIRAETLEQVQTNGHRVDNLPDYGSYNPNEIMEADYAFA